MSTPSPYILTVIFTARITLISYLVQIHGYRCGLELYPILSLLARFIDYFFTPFLFPIQCIINGMIIYRCLILLVPQ